MKLRIRRVAECGREELRTLLIDAAQELLGDNSCLLEAQLPWDGYPILFADAEKHPVLISFDLSNSQAALLGGLHCTDRLAAALPWLNQVYAALDQRQNPPRLIVVTDEPPPGSQAILRDSGQSLSLFTCTVLQVNGDTGILLEPVDAPSIGSGAQRPPATVEPVRAVSNNAQRQRQDAPDNSDELPPLTEQERAYFQQL
jgi:hypothetical protein